MTLGIVLFLALARRLVRVQWLAALIVIALFSLSFLGYTPVLIVCGVLWVALLVLVAIRFGLLAALTLHVLYVALHIFVMTADPSAWYFASGLVTVAVVLAVAIWGYRTAVPVRAVALAEA